MKIKYLRLNKKDKQKARENFLKTEPGNYVKKKLISVLWCAFFSIAIAIYIIVDAYLKNGATWEYIYGASIFILGIVFIILCRKIFIKKINDFITKK